MQNYFKLINEVDDVSESYAALLDKDQRSEYEQADDDMDDNSDDRPVEWVKSWEY